MNINKMLYDLAKGFEEGYGYRSTVSGSCSNASESQSTDFLICVNCGYEIGFIKKDESRIGELKSPCEREGKICVPRSIQE